MALLLAILLILVFAIIGLALMTQTASVLRKARLERKRIEVESFSRATMLDLRVAAQNYFVKMVAEAQEDINKTPIAGNQIPTLQQVHNRVKSMFPKYLPVSMSGGTLMHGVKPDPRWKGDGWEYMKGQGIIILNLDGIELHQVNGRPTAIGFFTLTVPYTVELDWDKQPDETDLIGVLGSLWHPQNLESKLAKEEQAKTAGKPKPIGGKSLFLIQPKYQNAFDLRMMVQLQIVPPPPGIIEWHIGTPGPGKPGPVFKKENCGTWDVVKQLDGTNRVENDCGDVLTGHFDDEKTAQDAANALNENDREEFDRAISDPSYHSICEDITGQDCPIILPGFGDNDWVGIGEYGSNGTDGYIVFDDIPPGSPTRNLKIKVGAFEPRFPMYRSWGSMLTRKRGE
jgi:hypothetical protein